VLLLDSAAFRKLFPEYVEKHDQELHSEQRVSSQAPQEDKSRAKLEKHGDSSVEDVKRVDAPKDERRNRKQPFPTWMMLLLVSIFGVVMALPLLQLWNLDWTMEMLEGSVVIQAFSRLLFKCSSFRFDAVYLPENCTGVDADEAHLGLLTVANITVGRLFKCLKFAYFWCYFNANFVGGLCLVLQLGVLCFLLVSKFCSRSLLKHYHCHTTFCCLVKRKTIPCLCTWLFIVCLMILIWPALLPYHMVHFVRSMWCSNTLSLLILTVYTHTGKKHTPRYKML